MRGRTRRQAGAHLTPKPAFFCKTAKCALNGKYRYPSEELHLDEL